MRSTRVGIEQIPDRLDHPVVVIDVLRAFTTAPWIVAGGATRLLLASSSVDALELKAGLGEEAVALTDRDLAPGFDLGNSPGQVRRFDLTGRPVVQTTTNGTVGVHASRHAPLVLCAGLVTASATARALAATGADHVVHVITGDGGTAEEDLACADLIDALLDGSAPPADTVSRVAGSSSAEALRAAMTAGYPGVHEDDIRLACEIDRFDVALRADVREGPVEVHADRGGR